MLSIRQDKGYVKRRRAGGRAHAYRAVVSAEQAKKSILTDVIDRAFDGSATDLVAALMSEGIVGKDELSAARKLLRKYEKKRGK